LLLKKSHCWLKWIIKQRIWYCKVCKLDFVPHLNIKELPSGSHKSIVKIIEDGLYVYGGLKVNEFNPDIIEDNNEIWKFNFINKVWKKITFKRIIY
jgi:hypothetical protein